MGYVENWKEEVYCQEEEDEFLAILEESLDKIERVIAD